MHLKRLLPLLVLLLFLPVVAFSQEKASKNDDRKEKVKEMAGLPQKPDPAKMIQDDQQRKRADMVKSVPMPNRTMDVIRMQNRKATMEQMHTINKAIRKSMTIHKRR